MGKKRNWIVLPWTNILALMRSYSVGAVDVVLGGGCVATVGVVVWRLKDSPM